MVLGTAIFDSCDLTENKDYKQDKTGQLYVLFNLPHLSSLVVEEMQVYNKQSAHSVPTDKDSRRVDFMTAKSTLWRL